MMDRVSRLAEAVATGMSRRGFLSWAGQGVLAAGAALGIPALANAAPRAKFCCICRDNVTGQITFCACGPNGCPQVQGSTCTQTQVRTCNRRTCNC
jgi:hypothetical protein